MSNTRGNTYSRGNLHLSDSDPKYWRWSMDELALIDLPAQIDKALAVSGAKKLGYVGHSQGCTLAYMLLAAKVSYNAKIDVVVHVGPVVFTEYVRAPFLRAGYSKAVQSDQVRMLGALRRACKNRREQKLTVAHSLRCLCLSPVSAVVHAMHAVAEEHRAGRVPCHARPGDHEPAHVRTGQKLQRVLHAANQRHVLRALAVCAAH